MKTDKRINKTLVTKLIKTINKGLSCGLGKPEPGEMCIEAAVNFAFGLPHGDNPPCVGYAVRGYKIALNDAVWSSNKARAKGMLGVGLAQLGSDQLDQIEFLKRIVLRNINTIVADLAKIYLPAKEKEFREVNDLAKAEILSRELFESAAKYAAESSKYAAEYAAKYAAKYAKYAAKYAAESAEYAKYAAKYAEYAEYAAKYAKYAKYAAKYAAEYAAKYAAEYAEYAADKVLIQAADNCLYVLKLMKSPGCKFLHLIKK